MPQNEYGDKLLKHISVELVGEDGNIFSLMGICARAVRRQGTRDDRLEWQRVVDRITDSKSYDEALAVIAYNLDVS